MALFIRSYQGLLDALAGKSGVFGTLGSPPDWHLGLSTTTPGNDGSNISEPVGNNYARIDVDPADFDAATAVFPPVVANNVQFSFGQASGPWGTIVSGVMFDALTGGNPLFPLSLVATFSVNSPQTVIIPAGNLIVAGT